MALYELLCDIFHYFTYYAHLYMLESARSFKIDFKGNVCTITLLQHILSEVAWALDHHIL